MQANSYEFVKQLYDESKFWIALVSTLWALFKGAAWIKAIKTNDLVHIQLTVNEVKDGLAKVQGELNTQTTDIRKEIKDQTNAVVGELSELRQDFRTFFAPPRAMVAKASRARKN